MKQKMVKRVMAFMLSAALALPGIPLETHAAGKAAGSESAMNMVDFAITNPDHEVQAYIGQPLVFYVRANGENVTYSAEGLESLGSGDNAATLDVSTGKFKWTPGAAGTRTVTFKATSGNGEDAVEVSKQVTINVGNSQSTTKTAYLTVAKDTFIGSWEGGTPDSNKNYGGMPVLMMNKTEGGLIGEDGSDSKITALQFDLGGTLKDEEGNTVSVDLTKVSNAYLQLTYVGTSSANSTEESAFYAKVWNHNDWTEGEKEEVAAENKELSWEYFEENRGENFSDITPVESGSYTLANIVQNAANIANRNMFNTTKSWNTSGKGYSIDGRKFQLDITEFVRSKLSADVQDKRLSFLLNKNQAVGYPVYFVSKEGAGLEDANKKFAQIESRNLTNVAPTLVLDYVDQAQEYGIAGKSHIALREGYEATGSDSFAVLGVEDGNTYDIALTGNTANGKIKWNAQEQRLEIEEGLTKGAYELTLTATQGSSSGQSRQAVTHDFTVFIKENVGLPVFTNPADTVQAYVNQPLAFYVKAEDPDFGDRVRYEIDENIEQSLGCQFDETTGAFAWTPQERHGDKSYTIKFYAYDHSNEPVEHTVTVHVADSSVKKETSEVINVAEDAYVQTWGNEKDKNYGGQNFLRLNYNSNIDEDDALNRNIGYLGEGLHNDSDDTKMSFLKFDLSNINKDKFKGAKLVLTYLGRVTSNGNKNHLEYVDGVNVRIRVAKVPVGEDGFTWTEGTQTGDGVADTDANSTALTWSKWRAWRDTDPDNPYSVAKDAFKSSGTYILDHTPDVYPDLAFAAGYAAVDGTKVKVDISEFVQESLDAGEDTLTLIFNNTYKGKLFVSKEGAANFTNKTALNGEPITGPQLVLLDDYETEIVEGPDGMVLAEGYEETKSDSFAVTGNSSEISITARGTDGKVTWDSNTNQIKIASGLDIGTYTVLLKKDNSILRRYELRVAANDVNTMQLMLEQKVLGEENSSRYTSGSWANYKYAVRAVRSLVDTQIVTGEELAEGRKLIQQARVALVTLEDELFNQIEAYKNHIYHESYYTEEGKAKVEALQTKIDEAQTLLDTESFTEAQINEKIAAMKTAFDSIADTDYTAKGLMQSEINEVKEQYGDDKKSGYTEASWTALQNAITDAETVFANVNATDAEISAAKDKMTAAVETLETLDDALARLIREAQDDIQGTETDYTEDSWEVYQTALEAVRGLSGSSYTERRMNQLLSLLDTAIRNLKFLEEQIPCTCEIRFTGFEGFTMAVDSTRTLAPSAVIDNSGCQAPEGKHITKDNVSFAYQVADAVTAGAPSVINVTNEGVVTAVGEGNATILVTVTITRPNSGSSSTTLTIPVTVNKTGEAEKVTVTFNSNGGTAVAAQKIDQNTAVSEPAAPTKAGYTFTGWYKDEALKEKYDFSQSVTEDITLYAGWTENKGGQTEEKVIKVGETTKIGDTEYQLAANNTLIVVKGADQATVTIPAAAKVNNIDCKVVGIGNGAYAGYKKVKKVVIGNNVTSIGDQAFANCTSLTNVTIGTGVTTIGKKAFFKDKKLKTVKISGTALKSIKGQAFKGTKANIKVKLPKKMKAAQKKKIKKLLKKAKISSKAVIK